MRFARTLVSFIGLTAMLVSGELWLRQGLAAQQSRIVFTYLGFDNYEIYVMDADGENQENLTNHPLDDRDPDWSPDGTKIAFVSSRNGGVYQIYVMDADGKNQIRLTDGPREKRYPDWSPDGGKIAFNVRPDFIDDVKPHIAVIDADGNNRVRHEDHAMDPSWSPDGQQIAFVSGRDGGGEIYVIGADRQGLKRVTHDLARKWNPSFSPDGGRIAYWGEGEGFFHIYVVGADGKNLKRLTHNQEHHGYPAWSSDEQTIAYVIADNEFFRGATIHLMTADGKYIKQLSDHHDGIDKSPDFSPVGLAVAVSPTSITTTIWGKLKKVELNRR